MANSNIYTPGGTVQAGRGLYISRQADEELLQLCQEGKYAYVLTSRQMGKSSLMIETARRLQQRGTTSIIIDLSDIGVADATAENWYRGVALEIENKLEEEGQALTTDVYEWWEAHSPLTITQRFTRFFRDVLLKELEGRVVVFIDEIDTTLKLGFTDDFFIAIRALYTTRAQSPSYERLSFVLIGVATPANLILDAHRTPFNIGHRVDLTDFTAAEAWPLAAGLGVNEADQANVFDQILAWTGGHPYLSQQLCIELSRQLRDRWNAEDVDGVVRQRFFGDRSDRDHNLQFVRDFLIDAEKCPDRYQVLATYRDIWRDRQPVLDEDQSLIKAHLKLSGVVKRVGSRLEVRNAIYREVFDGRWVRKHWPETWWEQIRPAMPVIGAVSAVAVVVAVVMGRLAFYAHNQRVAAIESAQKAEQQTKLAIDAAEEAIRARNNALAAQERADQERDNALAAQEETDQERKRADEERDRAQAEEERARQRRREAETANQLAEKRLKNALRAERQTEQARQAEAKQRQRAENEAFNAKILVKSQSIEGLIGVNLSTQAFKQAIVVAREIQEYKGKGGEIDPAIHFQAVSVLEKIYHSSEYLERITLDAHSKTITSISFSLDGLIVVTGSFDGTVKLWDRQGNTLSTINHGGAVNSVSFAPDSQTLASASSDGTVKLWDREGNQLYPLHVHTSGVNSVTFSPDGDTLASAGSDGTVRLWDRQGNELATLRGHGSGVNSVRFDPVSFDPDNQTLVSASFDGTVKLWNTQQEKALQTLRGHRGPVWSVMFSPDGRTLATSSADQTFRIWESSGRNRLILEDSNIESRDDIAILFDS